MPIEVDSEIRVFSEEEFHDLAYRVLGVIYGIQWINMDNHNIEFRSVLN